MDVTTRIAAITWLVGTACAHERPGGVADDAALPGPAEPDATIARDSGARGVDSGADEEIPRLQVLYAIHTHVQGDWIPYSGAGLRESEEQTAGFAEKAENMLDAIERIAEVLDRHGAPGTWEVVFGTAQGLCRYTGGPESNVFRDLVERGHEVGIHAHRSQDLERADSALRDECGIEPVTSSGYIAMMDEGEDPQAAVSAALAITQGLDCTVVTENLAPSWGRGATPDLCPEGAGVGNDMDEQTGSLLFPWRPDIDGQDPCAHDPLGPIVAVDHVSIEWVFIEGQQRGDVLTTDHFDNLRPFVESALQYLERERPERPAAWGFVTHVTEYAESDDASRPADVAAIDALDDFYEFLSSKRDEGRVDFRTAAEIASSVGE